MVQLKSFVCNAFQENTYVLFDETRECVIIDPGMNNGTEENTVFNFIKSEKLNPVLLLNTHCHIDHVLGNKWVHDTYGLLPQFQAGELKVLALAPASAASMGLQYAVSPLPEKLLAETGSVTFGNSRLDLIFAPGHSPAHLCFYCESDNFLIGGDVLFYGSIGRTDLPGGNFNQLIQNITEKLFALPDDCTVYPGHGPKTIIGFEKQHNPFLK